MTPDNEVPSGNTPLDLDKLEADAKLLEPHHEYRDAEPSRNGKRGVRCILCSHYTNGMERGSCSPCPNHASKNILLLISELRKARETIESYVGIMSRAELLASTREERLRSAEQALNQINTCPLEDDCHLCVKCRSVLNNQGHEIALAHFTK